MRLLHRMMIPVLLGVVCGCTPQATTPPAAAASEDPLAIEDNPPNTEGQPMLDDLARVARDADRIVVVEHSYRYDTNEGINSDTPRAERRYRDMVLANADKQPFLATLEGIDPYVSMWTAACIFEPHHRFEFYKGNKRTHTLEVCFQCNRLEWDGAKHPVPQAFYAGLAPFIQSQGMQPERDWQALARL
ncbi:hypothetical protein [Stenotrophomonas sp. 9(2022)]|uniref:hypothetical protein n=1 Tax=Stenotrophomonas sp. 9(2022) TaxID=2950153 RepID=UPI0021152E2B|nr:hypothetical protein [Stenotrophomonas sp. 9(2022)]